MELELLSPDPIVFWQCGFVKLNATMVYTWLVMAVVIGLAALALHPPRRGKRPWFWRRAWEAYLGYVRGQLGEMLGPDPSPVVPLIATAFVFILVSNLMSGVHGLVPPTASLSTTGALALIVFLAVPYFAVRRRGLLGWLRHFVRPTPFILPFQVMGEVSRTLAMAVRLFGNMLSGEKIVAVLLIITPLVVPVVMQLFGLLVGLLQAYIFAVLASVYIASAAAGGPGPKASETRGG